MANYESKFGRGDEVWVLHEGEPKPKRIGYVSIISKVERTGVCLPEEVDYGSRIYTPKGKSRGWFSRPESEVFATKEELLASL